MSSKLKKTSISTCSNHSPQKSKEVSAKDLSQAKLEVQQLFQKITDLVEKNPEKAGVILTGWINDNRRPNSIKKKVA